MHRQRQVEKINDFKGSLKRLFLNLNKWKYLLVIAVFFAMFAAILSTVAPNKLADVTDVISEGIKPRGENIEKVIKNIYSHSNIKVYEDSDQSSNDYLEMYNILSKEEKIKLFNDFKLDGVLITSKDQVEFLDILNTMDKDTIDEKSLAKLDKIPKSIKSFIEPKLDMEELEYRSIILGIIYLLNSIFTYAEGIIMAYVGIGYSKKLRRDISLKINRLPLKYFDTHETGDVLSRVTNDVDTIGINMSNEITSLVTNITLFLGSIVMMFVTNWIMALTAILASIVGFVFSFILLKKSQNTNYLNQIRQLKKKFK